MAYIGAKSRLSVALQLQEQQRREQLRHQPMALVAYRERGTPQGRGHRAASTPPRAHYARAGQVHIFPLRPQILQALPPPRSELHRAMC